MTVDSSQGNHDRQDPPGAWMRVESLASGELVIGAYSAEFSRQFKLGDNDLTGAKLCTIFDLIKPQAVTRRACHIAGYGGEALFSKCRYKQDDVELWFSLSMQAVDDGALILTFGKIQSGPTSDYDNPAWLTALDGFPWCVQTFDRTGISREVNGLFERAAGLTQDDLKEYNILYDPAYRREDLAGLIDRLFEGETIRFDMLAGHAARYPLTVLPKSRRRLYPAWGFPIVGVTGEVIGAAMIYEDTGGAKSPADYLDDERKFAAEIIDTADALIVCLDVEGRVTLFNPKCEETTGWKREEVLGALFYDILIPPRYVEKIRAGFKNLAQGGEEYVRFENPWLTRDGKERMISWHHSLHRGPDGQVDRITSVGIDITEKLRVENELRESSERYRSVTENALTGIFIYQDDRMIYCNNTLEGILGLTRDRIIGRTVWDFAHPDDRVMIRDRAKRRQRGDPDLPTHYSFRIINAAGETRWLEMTVAQMDYNGQAAILGNVVDITEKRQAESERDALRERLAQTQKMEALATLVGGIAHDFNNLLVGMMAGTSDVLAQTEPDDPRFKPLGEVLQISRRAKDLVSQLLTVGRRGPLEMVPLEINHAVNDAVRFVRSTLGPQIDLQVVPAEDAGVVLGDRNQLWQALTNLCLNARDAMPHGGTLEIATRVVRDDTVEIYVSDTGKGIPREIRGRIFEPFFTTKERGMGTGLGLAVVYGAIKNHGGTIEVHDRPGGGTIFCIRLGRIADKTDEPATPAKVANSTSNHTILIVDDEDGVRHVLGRILGREGHEVKTARDAEETMARIKADGSSIDLVILDLELPGKSGVEIFPQIKKAQPNLKVLLSSGQPLGPAAEKLLDQGAVGFLQKPYDLWELRNAIRNAVSAN